MHITIGILAYNEEATIRRTLDSLFGQTVFSSDALRSSGHRWEVLVVPNGCTDRTADVARDALLQRLAGLPEGCVSGRVESLAQAGKSRAWNALVHRLANPGTDIFVMIDADIEFGHAQTIESSVSCLLSHPTARVVVDLPLKDFTRKERMNWVEAFSARMSRHAQEGAPGIAGSFYCARAQTLRDVWMPEGISVEDGFLAAMVSTNAFREPPRGDRIVRAPNASHYFEGLTNLRSIVNHEVRLVIGTALNCYLCWDALLFLTPPSGPGAGETVRQLNLQHPEWYREMMMNCIRNRSLWVLPRGMLFRRFEGWRSLSWGRCLRRLPLSVASFAFDCIALSLANARLRAGRGIGYW